MKKKFMKGTMVLFALFVIFAFTGCEDVVNDVADIIVDNTDSSGTGVDTTGNSGNTGDTTSTYSVSKVVFVDQNGTAPSTSSSPTWSNIWETVKISATSALDTTFGTSNWQQSAESPLGTVTINSGHQDITLAKLDALKAVFANTFTIQSVEYTFTANYSAETKTITVTYTQKTSAGDSGNTGDNGNQGGVGDTGETTYTVIEIKLVDKDGNSPNDNSTPTWATIWYNTKDSINSIFTTAFTSNGWDSLQLTNTYGTIPINAGFQEINKAKYDALISSLNTKLDFTQVNVTYDFTASYDSTTKKITVMYLKPGESGNPGDGGNTETPTVPTAPQNVQATKQSDTEILLSWDAVEGASKYAIYESLTSSVSSAQLLNGEWTSTSARISEIQSNTTYYYWITAKNSQGESVHSSMVSIMIEEEQPQVPSVPQNLRARAVAGVPDEVNLSWNSSQNAVRYVVYEHTTNNPDSASVVESNVTGTSAIYGGLESGKTYYYWITALNANGDESDYSNVATFTTEKSIKPPQNVTVDVKSTITGTKYTCIKCNRSYSSSSSASSSCSKGGNHSLRRVTIYSYTTTIEWLSVADATFYTIYRSLKSGVILDAVKLTTVTGKTSYTHSVNGSTYNYWITATNADGEESDYSALNTKL